MTNIMNQDRFYLNLSNEELTWIYSEHTAADGYRYTVKIITRALFNFALQESFDRLHSVYNAAKFFGIINKKVKEFYFREADSNYNAINEKFHSTPASVGTTVDTINSLRLMYNARDLIEAYTMEEFYEHADFDIPESIGLAYTMSEDDEHDIQVFANLIDYQTEYYIDGELVKTEKARDLADYIANYLTYLSFDELIAEAGREA